MDILDKLLSFAQISAGVNVKCQLQGEWLLDNAAQTGQAVAHIVSKGTAYLHTAQGVRLLGEGDMVFLPRMVAHALSHDTQKMPNAPLVQQQQQGGFVIKQVGDGDADCELFCLHFHYDKRAMLMESLPENLILTMPPTPLQNMVAMLKAETQQPDWASESVVNALALVILTLILREYLAQHDNRVLGALKAWQEPRLRSLLKAVLACPESAWQLDKMATMAHLSRSQLIRLFRQHLQTTPHAFVHQMRLQKAAMLLKQKSDSVIQIALSTGFQSETHFSQAFKKAYGKTPSAYRTEN